MEQIVYVNYIVNDVKKQVLKDLFEQICHVFISLWTDPPVVGSIRTPLFSG